MYDFNFSRPFNPYKWSDTAQVNNAATYLLGELRHHIGRNVNQKRREYLDVLKRVILDLFIAYGQSPKLFLAYSRRKGDYIGGRRYRRAISYEKMVGIVDALAALSYIYDKVGFYKRDWNEGKRSRMIARPKLIELLDQAAVRANMVKSMPDEIILRAADDRSVPVDFRETNSTITWRDNVGKINTMIGRTNVHLELPDKAQEQFIAKKGFMPDSSHSTLYRVFNNGRFNQGGRFYGHFIQNVPKEFRPLLTIDGEPTTELDYSGLHINLLYMKEGLKLPEGDVYVVGGLDRSLRPLLKKVLTITLNARNELSAIRAIRQEDVAKRYSHQDIREIMSMFAAKHEPIRKYFNSGIGIKLQFIDSEIAENIMLSLARGGIAALGIHDSFIVKARHEGDLRDAMNQAMLRRFGSVIPIDKRF